MAIWGAEPHAVRARGQALIPHDGAPLSRRLGALAAAASQRMDEVEGVPSHRWQTVQVTLQEEAALMADKQEFLRMVRTSLGVSARRDIARDDATAYFLSKDEVSQTADDIRTDAAERRTELVDEFIHRATEAGWKIHRVANFEDAAEEVTAVVREHDATVVMRSDHDILNSVPIETALKVEGVDIEVAVRDPSDDADEDLERRLALRERSFDSEVGITGVDFAVAETGTVAMEPQAGSSRLVSLTPEVHIGVMTPESIIPSLDELFALTRDHHRSGEHKGMINLITGPSRTADIEANLIIGVHGPREVHLVIVG